MASGSGNLTVEQVKAAARGREIELVNQVGGAPLEILDGKHHACPRPGCGGTDRFSVIDPHAGALLCRHCFKEKNGDFVAAIMWLRGWTLPEALRAVGEYLGLSIANGSECKRKPARRNASAAPAGPQSPGPADDPPTDPAPSAPPREKDEYARAMDELALKNVAEAKGVTTESLMAYGAKVERGQVVLPMFGPDGAQCSTFELHAHGKGKNEKDKSAGLFLPGRLPQPGETWCVVEGCKDAAALHSLGYLAAGLPTSSMNKKFAPLFRGVHVIVIADGDKAGRDGAAKTVKVLT